MTLVILITVLINPVTIIHLHCTLSITYMCVYEYDPFVFGISWCHIYFKFKIHLLQVQVVESYMATILAQVYLADSTTVHSFPAFLAVLHMVSASAFWSLQSSVDVASNVFHFHETSMILLNTRSLSLTVATDQVTN